MLDVNSRKILRYLNKFSNKTNPITCYVISEKCKIDIEFTNEITEQLYKDKLLNRKCIANSNKLSVYGVNHYYSTNKGKYYFSVNRKKTINKYLQSIICPLIVALITSLITTLTVDFVKNDECCNNTNNNANNYDLNIPK